MDSYHHWITKEKVDEIVEKFIHGLDKKFQRKAIISLETSNDIKCVFNQKENNGSLYGTASFRFWARKRFTIKEDIVCSKNDSKPVCLKEDIYKTVLKAHINCDHKGKELTYKQIHRLNSYFPKTLVELIIKECIHCNIKKESKKVEFYDIVDLYFDNDDD